MTNYTTTITCSIAPKRVYQAITEEMSNWWTPMSGKFLEVGDEARTGFGAESYWVFTARALSLPSLVELECTESRMLIGEHISADEWLGTVLRFDITESDGQTLVVFTHSGLHPELPCYEVCSAGWNHYIAVSLKEYLSTGGGVPNSY